MQNPKDYEVSKYNDLIWCFLAEYSLRKFVVDENMASQSTTGLLFQVTQGLGMPVEFLKSIERSLMGFVREAMSHFNQDRLDSLVYIRLFCQRKTIEEIYSVRTSGQLNLEPAEEPTQKNRHYDAKKNGGWGYFLVERRGDLTPGSAVNAYHLIDVYLYKEGK